MAISGGDGSIILTTKVDTSGIKAGTTAIKTGFKGAGIAATSFGVKTKSAIAGISTSLKRLFSMFIGIQTIFKVINFSGEAAQFATQTEASVQRLVDIYGEASQVVGDFIDANARAIGMSKSAGASIAATYGNLLSVWADQETNAKLTNALLNQTAVVASKTGRTTTDVAERIRSGLLGNTEAIEDLGINVNIKTIEITEAFKRIADGRSWEQLNAYEQSQVRTLAILEQSTNKYGTTVAETSATVRNQYQAAYEDFKNTWGQVVNTILIPVLKVLTQVFTIATKGLQIIAGLTGKTIDTNMAFSDQEKAIGGAVDNQKALTDAVKGTNKELKKSLAGFDEINILSQDTAESGGAGATGASGGVGGIGDLGLDYDNSIVDKISGDMTAIMAIVGGALAAVGLLLIFFGRIGWGIGFLIAGASAFAVSMATLSSGDQVTPISEQLMTILGIAGVALTAIGLILLFSGSFLWGIAFIIAGASALSVAVVALKQGKVSEEAKKMLTNIMTIAGTAILALGVILLCFGVVTPLSIGLVVAGASSLAGAIALNPQFVFESVSKFFTDNAGLIVGISLALLVLGIVLCVCGVITPLSIGMIVAGAAGLVTEIALNWGAMTKAVSDFIKQNTALFVGIGVALVALGIILLCCGVIPLGLGLLVAGGVSLAMAIAPNWNAILDKVKEITEKIGGFFTSMWDGITAAAEWAWNGIIAVFKTGGEIFVAIKNGIVEAFKWLINNLLKGINKVIALPFEGLNKILNKIQNLSFLGVSPFKWLKWRAPVPEIPLLAKGAVLPPNKPFLALVGDQKHGTNIEAPLQTIVDAFNIALQNNGGGQTTKEEHYYLGETELMQIVYKLFKGGERLQGPSLISGGVR